MGIKSRAHWLSGACFKSKCINRDIKCHECYKINGKESEYDESGDIPGDQRSVEQGGN